MRFIDSLPRARHSELQGVAWGKSIAALNYRSLFAGQPKATLCLSAGAVTEAAPSVASDLAM